MNGEGDVQLSPFGLLLHTQPLHSSKQHTRADLVTLVILKVFKIATRYDKATLTSFVCIFFVVFCQSDWLKISRLSLSIFEIGCWIW